MTQNRSSGLSEQRVDTKKAQLQSMRRKMFAILGTTIVLMWLISLILAEKYATEAFRSAYFMGALVGFLNGGIGFWTVEKFIDKTSIVFMKGVFIGMGIRMLLLLGVFVLLIKVFEFHIVGLVTGLLVFYFTMTIFEVAFLNMRIKMKRTIGTSL